MVMKWIEIPFEIEMPWQRLIPNISVPAYKQEPPRNDFLCINFACALLYLYFASHFSEKSKRSEQTSVVCNNRMYAFVQYLIQFFPILFVESKFVWEFEWTTRGILYYKISLKLQKHPLWHRQTKTHIFHKTNSSGSGNNRLHQPIAQGSSSSRCWCSLQVICWGNFIITYISISPVWNGGP